MRKRICVEVDGVFYSSLMLAGEVIGYRHKTIKNRSLSDKFPNYKIVPFRITYAEKKCITCGKTKLLGDFCKCAVSRDGLKGECKECQATRFNEYHEANPEKEKERNKEYRNKNKEKILKNKKIYNKEHKEEIKEYRKGRRKETAAYKKERRKTDIAFKVHENMGNAIRISLNGLKHGAGWESLVDYDLKKLMIHLESKFTKDMNWDNYGWGDEKWNIDHVIAKCHFNTTSNTCQEFKDCWALNNLQPLWQTRNFEKGDKPMEPKYLIKPF